MSLLNRFLQYSLMRGRPIKVMVMTGDDLRSLNITVTGMDDTGFTYTTARSKTKEVRLAYDQLLSASYARGDDGDTLRRPQDT